MDPLLQSLSGVETESNQCSFVTNQTANLQESNGTFMEGLRVRQNSRRSKSFCENAVETNAQLPDDSMATERRPITGINGHSQRPTAMIVASQFGGASPRAPMQTTPRTPMQATPRTPMQASRAPRFPREPTSRPPRPMFRTSPINNMQPQNVSVRQVLVLPSLMQMPLQGPRASNIFFSAGFRQPQNWYPEPQLPTAGHFQSQGGAPVSGAIVNVCNYCKSSGEQYSYGHTRKNCPKLASMLPCHRCGAVGTSNHTDMYCPANKTLLSLKRSEEEHQQYLDNLKKGQKID